MKHLKCLALVALGLSSAILADFPTDHAVLRVKGGNAEATAYKIETNYESTKLDEDDAYDDAYDDDEEVGPTATATADPTATADHNPTCDDKKCPCGCNAVGDCDVDSDGDGVHDYRELLDGTESDNACSFDHNHIRVDCAKREWYSLDCDGDCVSNYYELVNGTNLTDSCSNFMIESIDANIALPDYYELIEDYPQKRLYSWTYMVFGEYAPFDVNPNDTIRFNYMKVCGFDQSVCEKAPVSSVSVKEQIDDGNETYILASTYEHELKYSDAEFGMRSVVDVFLYNIDFYGISRNMRNSLVAQNGASIHLYPTNHSYPNRTFLSLNVQECNFENWLSAGETVLMYVYLGEIYARDLKFKNMDNQLFYLVHSTNLGLPNQANSYLGDIEVINTEFTSLVSFGYLEVHPIEIRNVFISGGETAEYGVIAFYWQSPNSHTYLENITINNVQQADYGNGLIYYLTYSETDEVSNVSFSNNRAPVMLNFHGYVRNDIKAGDKETSTQSPRVLGASFSFNEGGSQIIMLSRMNTLSPGNPGYNAKLALVSTYCPSIDATIAEGVSIYNNNNYDFLIHGGLLNDECNNTMFKVFISAQFFQNTALGGVHIHTLTEETQPYNRGSLDAYGLKMFKNIFCTNAVLFAGNDYKITASYFNYNNFTKLHFDNDFTRLNFENTDNVCLSNASVIGSATFGDIYIDSVDLIANNLPDNGKYTKANNSVIGITCGGNGFDCNVTITDKTYMSGNSAARGVYVGTDIPEGWKEAPPNGFLSQVNPLFSRIEDPNNFYADECSQQLGIALYPGYNATLRCIVGEKPHTQG